MRELWRLVLSISVSGSALILLMLAVRPLFKNRLSKAWQYYLWIIVLLRLAIPYTPSLGVVPPLFRAESPVIAAISSFFTPKDSPSSQTGETTPASAGQGYAGYVTPGSGTTQPEITAGTNSPRASEDASEVTAAANSKGAINTEEVLGLLWLTGAVLILTAKSVQYAAFVRKIRRSARTVTNGEILKDFSDTLALLGLRWVAPPLLSTEVSSPMLIGLVKPVVILPESVLAASRTGLPYIFRHELTHLKRRDILYKWLTELVLCVHWFNPLAHLMTRYIAEDCELSCDEAVAFRLGTEEKRAYGNALLDAAAEQAACRRHFPLMTLRDNKISMKERLKIILSTKKKSKAAALAAVAVATALCLSGILLGACATVNTSTGSSASAPPTADASPSASPGESAGITQEEQAVRSLVESFGKVLKNVSLLAPDDELVKSIKENYSSYVTPELLGNWLANPSVRAAGRVASSPWPDRIDISSAVKNADGSYTVTGSIIEVTSTEVQSGTAASTRSLTIKIVPSGGKWLISEFTAGPSIPAGSLVYQNTQFGFDLTLPKDWKGYTVVTDKWTGTPLDSSVQPAAGAELLIRSPKWTSAVPTFDIPIMVFTLAQWDQIQQEKLAVSAAPVPPTELGRNSVYVFALPPRYDFYDYPGRDEVLSIIGSKPLQPTETITAMPTDTGASASPTAQNTIVYKNSDYGFDLTLPASWKGYTIISQEWKGTMLGDSQQAGPTGPELLIRSPKWTKDKPTQDIPIMVFTLQQWTDLQKEKFAVSAAPIPPSELGRNSKYVFALPPRYNFAFLPGYEEVDQIIQSNPLAPNENFK